MLRNLPVINLFIMYLLRHYFSLFRLLEGLYLLCYTRKRIKQSPTLLRNLKPGGKDKP